MSIKYLPATGLEPCVTHPERWDALDGSEEASQAKWQCRSRCGIRQACLDYALDLGDVSDVIYGGATGPERERMLRERRQGRAA